MGESLSLKSPCRPLMDLACGVVSPGLLEYGRYQATFWGPRSCSVAVELLLLVSQSDASSAMQSCDEYLDPATRQGVICAQIREQPLEMERGMPQELDASSLARLSYDSLATHVPTNDTQAADAGRMHESPIEPSDLSKVLHQPLVPPN